MRSESINYESLHETSRISARLSLFCVKSSEPGVAPRCACRRGETIKVAEQITARKNALHFSDFFRKLASKLGILSSWSTTLLVPRGVKRIQKLPTSHRKLTQSEARKMFQAELFLLHFLNHFAAFSSIRLKALEVRKAGGKHALTLKA